MTTITRSYRTYETAEGVVRALEKAGVPSADISLLSNNSEGWYSDEESRNGETSGTGAGMGVGATVGGAAGLLAGLGLMAIPGLGPIVAAGWLASTAVGAAAGGAAGGLIGALADSGVSREDAEYYAEGVRRGDTLVVLRTSEAHAATAQAIMDRDAIDFDKRRAAWRSEGWEGYDPAARAYSADEVRAWRSRGL